MNAESDKRSALVARPASALEKAVSGAKRILAVMVHDTLKIAQKQLKPVSAPLSKAQIECWYQHGMRNWSGDLASLCRVSWAHSRGEIPLSFREAVKWYRRAAEQGHAGAQFKLGKCYEFSSPKDAVKWCRKAAEQGHAEAQFQLGDHYCDGCGVPQDYTEAGKWFGKAAEQGDAVHQERLGDYYYSGCGVPEDYTEQSDAQHQERLSQYFRVDCGVPQDYTAALKWYRAAAEQGYSRAQFKLGTCYDDGWGVAKDVAEAVKWYRKAAERGHRLAQHTLGVCYYAGHGVPPDHTEAMKWYRLSADGVDHHGVEEVASIGALLSQEEFQEAERRYNEFKATHKEA